MQGSRQTPAVKPWPIPSDKSGMLARYRSYDGVTETDSRSTLVLHGWLIIFPLPFAEEDRYGNVPCNVHLCDLRVLTMAKAVCDYS